MRTLVGEGIGVFYSSRALTSPCGIRSLFLLGISSRRILWDPFLMGIPLDSAKHGEQVISLYTRYLGGKQSLVSTVGYQYPYACDLVSPMKASAL